jgi:predicted naringenin-chalcone synthase
MSLAARIPVRRGRGEFTRFGVTIAGAPTVFFVLERALRDGLDGRALMTALGPGFTVAFQVLEP